MWHPPLCTESPAREGPFGAMTSFLWTATLVSFRVPRHAGRFFRSRRFEEQIARQLQENPMFRKCHLVQASLMLLMLVMFAGVTFAQSNPPLVYNVENTGANFAAPTFPSFEQLPIVRPL